MINQTIYRKLIEKAKEQNTLYYEDIANLVNLNLKNPDERYRILGEYLGEINEYEEENGRPMLSAVVVRKNDTPRKPAQGFFDLAISLGKMNPRQSKDEFYRGELKRVFEYWKKH